MKLPLAYYGNPILRQKGAPVQEITPEIRELVQNMIETMDEERGIGIAAPQVNYSLSIFVTRVPVEDEEDENKWKQGEVRVFINPKILSYSEDIWENSEGCLSIPKVYGNVVRPYSIKVQAMDLEGNVFIEDFSDLEARCIMHENDHINGTLFIDRMNKEERKALDAVLRDLKKKLNR